MARITELPPAAAATGAELVPVVQGGVMKQGLLGELVEGLAQPFVDQAQDHAQDAMTARDITLAATTPPFASIAAGEAATATGEAFAVAAGDGTSIWYRRTVGGSTYLFTPATRALTDAIDERNRRNERKRPLGTLLRGRKYRAQLGAKNGYTSAGSAAAAVTIASVADFPFDPPFGIAPNILTQKPTERRSVTGITAPGSAEDNYLTVTCAAPHGLAAGDRVRFYGSTFPGPNSINTDINEALYGNDGAQGAKFPYPSVTPADVLAGRVAKGIDVFDAPSATTFRVKIAPTLGWTDTTSAMWWEPLPRFWPATDAVFDWVVPGRREALPRNQPGAGKPSFGTASTGELGASGASATTNAQVKIPAVEFPLYEDVLVMCSRGGKFRIFAEGVPIHNGVLDLSSPDSPGYRTTITFPDSQPRLIRIETTNAPGSNFAPADIYGFWTRGRNAIGPARAQDQRRPLMLLCGDSFVEGEGIPNWHLSFGSLMAERLGWNVIHGGLGSTGLTTGGAHGVNMNYGDRMKVMKAGGVEPDVVCVLNSLNDFGNVTEVLATKFIDRLRALWPNVEIVVLGSSYPNEDIPAGRTTSDLAWLAAANARGVPFIDGGIGTQGLPVWVTEGNKATYYHGTAATATATASGGAVSAIALVSGGAGYDPANGAPLVSLVGGGGTGAEATATVNYQVTDIQIINGGRDYTAAALAIGHGAYASAIESEGKVVGVMVNNPGGVLFTSAPTISFIGGGGAGAAATPVLEGGKLVAIDMTNPGSGYTSAPTVVIGICSAEATATPIITDGKITGATITSAGEFYTQTPIITVTGDGYGAELLASISGTVSGFTVTEPGTGYATAPAVTIAHPNGDDVTHPKPNGHRLLAHRYVAGIEQQVAA